MKKKFIFKLSIFTIILSLILNTFNVLAEENNSKLNNIKSSEVKKILENSIVFENNFFEAIVFGEKKLMVENDYKSTAIIKSGETYVPLSFLESLNSDISLTGDGKYVSLKEFCDKTDFKLYKYGELSVISKDNIVDTLLKTNFKDVEKLFGIFVDVNAQFTNAGTITEPVSNIEIAKNLVPKVIQSVGFLGDGIKVYIRGGTYSFKKGVTFSSQDSGTENCKITYTNFPNESVTFDGGITLKGDMFSPVETKDIISRIPSSAIKYVREIDLKKLNYVAPLTATDPRNSELYYNGEVMQVSRWPNFEFDTMGENKRVGGSADPGITFVVNNERIKNWGKANDAWIFGFWKWTWDGNPLKVTEINLKDKTVSTKTNPRYTPIGSKMPWYIYNLVEELDTENEFFIDNSTSKLYVFPYISHINDGRFKEDKIQMPLLKEPMIKIDGASNLNFEGIVFENTTGNFIDINNGNNISVNGCILRNTTSIGINIKDGKNITVQSCDIYNTGLQGIYVVAGDRQNLIPANHLIENNRIFNTARIQRTNCGAVMVGGVGIKIRHNEIFNSPHSVLALQTGVDILIEYNEIYDGLTDQAHDAGALYGGRNPTSYDYVIRYNYIHDMPENCMGTIYLDDHLTGYNIYGNVFYNIGRALFVHGGQYNQFNNNIQIYPKGDKASAYYQGSGIYTWDPKTRKVISASDGWEAQILPIDPYNPAWLEKYPQYKKIIEAGRVQYPENGVANNNVTIYKTKEQGNSVSRATGVTEQAVEMKNNIETTEDIGFEDLNNLDFSLKKDAKVFTMNPDFKDIPFKEMGIYTDKYRTDLPNLDTFGLIYPTNGQMELEAREVTFRWQNTNNTRLYRFQLATDREFKNIIRDEYIEGNSLTVKNLRYSNSRYYWKVVAVAQNNKNIKKGESVPCDTEYYYFTTKASETIDKSSAQILLENSQTVYDQVVEGDKPGEYFNGVKTEMGSALDKYKADINTSNMSQRKLNKLVSTFESQMSSLKGKRNSEILPINKLLSIQTEWSFQENKAYFNKDGISWTRGEKADRDSAGYKAKKIENYQLLKLNLQLDFPNPSWMYLGIRASDTTGGYAASTLYFVVIKQNIFELQKRGGGQTLFKEYPNDVIKYGEKNLIEFGALDTEDGNVRIIFKVNGNTIIDYVDSDQPLKDPGYFTVYSSGVGNTIKIMPVEEE